MPVFDSEEAQAVEKEDREHHQNSQPVDVVAAGYRFGRLGFFYFFGHDFAPSSFLYRDGIRLISYPTGSLLDNSSKTNIFLETILITMTNMVKVSPRLASVWFCMITKYESEAAALFMVM